MNLLRPQTWSPAVLLLLAAACSAQAPAGPASTKAPRVDGRSTALARSPDVPEAVRQLTARGPETREVTEGRIAGSRVVRIRDGNAEVMVARTNQDGSVSTRCVDSAEGAQAFLGEKPVAAGAVRAAQ
jgi:hypothetical protein